MDDATRARLESIHDRLGLQIWDVEARKDVEAVAAMLAAYDTLLAEHKDCADWEKVNAVIDERDALLAERDDARAHIQTLEAVMKSDETLNRLQAFNTQLSNVNGDLLKRIKALEAAQAQAQADLAAWREGRVDVMHDWRNRCLAAEAAQAQAAPVLAAAWEWRHADFFSPAYGRSIGVLMKVVDEYTAWRAAREG